MTHPAPEGVRVLVRTVFEVFVTTSDGVETTRTSFLVTVTA
jgi:hypothetical protein